MKLLVIDFEPLGIGLNLCLRCQDVGDDVRYWQPTKMGNKARAGENLVNQIHDWKAWMRWADMIVLTDNSKYRDEFDVYFKKGFPIFGCNKLAGDLELDRNHGQEMLDSLGINIIPYETFTNFDKAIEYVKKTNKVYVSKPLGDADKAMSYVPQSPADLIFKLERWKKENAIKNGFILQEMCKGVEMAVGCWFGPGGWSSAICENWEEKRFMNDGLGENTGEQGTTLRYVSKSKLFKEVLEPCGEYLKSIKYIGYVDMNCIIDKQGTPRPLEFTMRFGWPLFNIQLALHKDAPSKWMFALMEGKSEIKVSSDVAVGVVISHGDYPRMKNPVEDTDGFPLYGIHEGNRNAFHPVGVRDGVAPLMFGNKIKESSCLVTTNSYIGVVTGTGSTISEAQEDCYNTAWELNLPSNRMFRTDIGTRLGEQVKDLHKMGYAKDLEY